MRDYPSPDCFPGTSVSTGIVTITDPEQIKEFDRRMAEIEAKGEHLSVLQTPYGPKVVRNGIVTITDPQEIQEFDEYVAFSEEQRAKEELPEKDSKLFSTSTSESETDSGSESELEIISQNKYTRGGHFNPQSFGANTVMHYGLGGAETSVQSANETPRETPAAKEGRKKNRARTKIVTRNTYDVPHEQPQNFGSNGLMIGTITPVHFCMRLG
ncbi:hypothetical protein EST38_g9968 [Candolleomyces aberdarensis]|uniref:Uncharacterized protein n=1 Tax=Candolleomyces aberdarensis TaxID=2316362 RepID=A0A4V1Q2Q2_9AGAR|nr:hypothetical protein EST38_g9968 [Candolleomyces aberdarensis]